MTDYGSVELQAIGHDSEGNPRFRKSNASGEIVVLKLESAKKGHSRHAVNVTTTLICKLLYHEFITKGEYNAAMTLKEDWYNAGMSPRLGSDYSPCAAASEEGRSEAQEKAYKRWRNAMKALTIHANIVSDVILFDKTTLRIDILQDGIAKLKNYYGIA